MSTTMTNILLHDVVIDILSRLPVKSLLRFRCVSKDWNIFFSDPSFIKMHLNHSINNYEHLMLTGSSYIIKMHLNHSNNNHQQSSSLAANDDEVVEIVDYPFKATYGCTILGSCNGLLLITRYDDNVYYIWNPSTKEFKKLPDTPIKILGSCKVYTRSVVDSEHGFGYDKIIEDYKVVRIVTFDDYSSEVQVYTLGSDSWRRIQDIPGSLALARRTAGNLVNGVLHWVVERKFITRTSYSLKVNNVSRVILSFDIEDEKYGEIQQPDFIDTKFHMNVEVLGGCLCIMCNFHGISYSDIWVMKEYGVKESWTKLFTIPYSRIVRPIKFTKNGEVLLKRFSSLVMYDPKDGSAKTLQIRGLENWLGTDIYAESLISLNSSTFVGQEQSLISINSGTSVGQEQARGM